MTLGTYVQYMYATLRSTFLEGPPHLAIFSIYVLTRLDNTASYSADQVWGFLPLAKGILGDRTYQLLWLIYRGE